MTKLIDCSVTPHPVNDLPFWAMIENGGKTEMALVVMTDDGPAKSCACGDIYTQIIDGNIKSWCPVVIPEPGGSIRDPAPEGLQVSFCCDGSLDEVTAASAKVHIENLQKNHWFICVSNMAIWFHSDSQISASFEMRTETNSPQGGSDER